MTCRLGLLIICAFVAILPENGIAIVAGELETGFIAVGALEDDAGFWTSGTLIDPYWVLTTASSVENATGGTFHVGFDRAAPSESHLISAIFPSPFFDPNTGQNDIALLRLATPVTSTTPIPYLTSTSSLVAGSSVRYVGYGWATVSDPDNTRRRSCLNTVDAVSPTTFVTLNSTTGPYHGDVGGPALLQVGDIWYVAGIISIFPDGPLQLTQSTKVAPFDSFLADVIATNPPPPTGVNSPPEAMLHLRASPNPFNPSTTISFELPHTARAQLSIYDAAGRLVISLQDPLYEAGRHEFHWYGLDHRGRAVASGAYTLRLQAGVFVETLRVTLLK